jgi:hypothetical protein
MFDFEKVMAGKSDSELIEILSDESKYQTEAIAAAKNEFSRRELSENQIESTTTEEPVKTAIFNKETLVTSLRSIIYTPNKLINLVLAIAILDYLHLFYIDMKALNHVLHGGDYPFRMVSIMSHLDLLTLPVVFFMFYKRMRWGWILFFGSKLFTIVPSFIYYFSYYLYQASVSVFPLFIWGVFLNIAMLFVLWNEDVRSIFKVNRKTSQMTVYVIAIILLLWLLLRGMQ